VNGEDCEQMNTREGTKAENINPAIHENIKTISLQRHEEGRKFRLVSLYLSGELPAEAGAGAPREANGVPKEIKK
jgi:hypothetical protein